MAYLSYVGNDPTATGGNSTDQGLWQNINNITTAVTITTSYNGLSGGPVTIGSGGSVTIPSGSVWTIV